VTHNNWRGLRKSWHIIRNRFGAESGAPKRLVIEKAKWLNDARSPVMVMVDDLANAWHNRCRGDRWEIGGDWGGGLRNNGSVIRFLEDRFLRNFPEIKITFFTVAGPLSSYTFQQPFSYAAPLDINDDSKEFFYSLSVDPRFELAYHGYDHGTPGVQSKDFIQEWRGFSSKEAAIAQTKRGLEIFSRVTGAVPQGGKYGGWDYNDFADEVVDDCEFLWWCRDWMPRDVTGRFPENYYEPQLFGRNLLVALPSTVHGHFWARRQINLLLQLQQVIAVEEHIAPIRPDGVIQTPNIIDDLRDLCKLFSYLKEKNVWYATGSEVATYVIARDRSLLYDVTRDGFSLRYDGRIERPSLTLRIDSSAICSPKQPVINVILPDGTAAEPNAYKFDPTRYQHIVTVPVIEGEYRVLPGEI
jgi:hypothetical protein